MKRKTRKPPSAASLRRALARCASLLEDINGGEVGWTTGDVEVVLDEVRALICRDCRAGRPHAHTEEAES